MTDRKRTRSAARLGVVLFALAALMSFGVSLTFAAPPFTTNINVDDVTDFTVTISGTADSPSKASHHMVIEWGDGNVDTLPDFDTDAPWSWGPVSHTYLTAGEYTITVTLIHSQDQGNDQGAASDSTTVTIPGPCTVDCEGPGSSDDGTTDDGTTDDNVPTEVLPRVIKKPSKLAKTGPETAGLAIVGISLVMAGVMIRKMATLDAPKAG